MVGRSRNLCLYPNVYLMDQFSSQIRTYRPIAVDKTEVTIYCIAPKWRGAVNTRTRRIRQYEDFFNASGMATPDDLEEFRACQMAMMGTAARSGTTCAGVRSTGSRGRTRQPAAIGLKPLLSGLKTEDEGLFVVQHKYWQETMQRAAKRGNLTMSVAHSTAPAHAAPVHTLPSRIAETPQQFLYREARAPRRPRTGTLGWRLVCA